MEGDLPWAKGSKVGQARARAQNYAQTPAPFLCSELVFQNTLLSTTASANETLGSRSREGHQTHDKAFPSLRSQEEAQKRAGSKNVSKSREMSHWEERKSGWILRAFSGFRYQLIKPLTSPQISGLVNIPTFSPGSGCGLWVCRKFRLEDLKSSSSGVQEHWKRPGPSSHRAAGGHQLCLQRVVVPGTQRACRSTAGSRSPEVNGGQTGPAWQEKY